MSVPPLDVLPVTGTWRGRGAVARDSLRFGVGGLRWGGRTAQDSPPEFTVFC
jgi:hypothetical protein